MTLRVVLIALIVVAGAIAINVGWRPLGGSGRADATDEPTSRPSVAAWKIAVTDATYTSETSVGGDITVLVEITNTGTARNPGIQLQFSDIDDYADLIGCDPACDRSEFFGTYTELPGVAAGATVTYQVNWLAKTIGAVNWSMCVYDDTSVGEQVGCYDGVTTIR